MILFSNKSIDLTLIIIDTTKYSECENNERLECCKIENIYLSNFCKHFIIISLNGDLILGFISFFFR